MIPSAGERIGRKRASAVLTFNISRPNQRKPRMLRSRRLPRTLEREIGRILSATGFSEYGSFFWNISSQVPPKNGRAPLDPALVEEMLGQVEHDPSALPFGRDATPFVKRRNRTLSAVSHVSSKNLLGGRNRADAMIIASRLDDKSCSEISRTKRLMRDAGACSFVIVFTDQFTKKANPSLIRKFEEDQLVLWRDHYWADGYWAARLFALFLHALGPAAVVSLRSRLGVETIGSFGKALKTSHRLYLKLDVPEVDPQTLALENYYLRLALPHATVLTDTCAEAKILRGHAEGLPGRGITALEDCDVTTSAGSRSIFGASFEDLRSIEDQIVAATLLRNAKAHCGRTTRIDPSSQDPLDFDVTATILFHREGELAVPALRSFAQMIDVARRDNIRIEARAMLDNADDATRNLVTSLGTFLDDVVESSLGDPAAVRNSGTRLARGRFLAFFDGDDLWGANWLRRAYRAAIQHGTDVILHPEAYLLFYASDCLLSVTGQPSHEEGKTELYFQQTSLSADFEAGDLLLESLWTVNAFAPRAVHMGFPYRLNDSFRQVGVEDWRWNLETLGHGIQHVVVPGTVHLIRMKEGGSVGKAHASEGLLPFLV